MTTTVDLRLGDVVQRGEHMGDRARRGVVVWADGECAIEQRLHPGHRYVVQLVAHGVIHTSNGAGEWTVVPDELVTHTERIMSLLHTWSPPPWADDPDDATDAHSFEWDGLAAMLTVEDRKEFEEGDWPSNYEMLLAVARRVDALEAGDPERRSLLERAALRLVEAVDADVQVGLVNARSTTGDAALDLAEILRHQMGSTPIDAERRRMAAMSVPIIPVAAERLQPGDRLIAPGSELEVLRLELAVARRVDALEAGDPERRSLLERAALRLVEAVDADVQVGLVNARSTTGDAALDLAEFLGHQMGSTPIDVERRRMAAMSVPLIPVAAERLQPGDRLIAPGSEPEVLRLGQHPGEVYLGAPHNGLMELAGQQVWIRRPGT